MFFFVNGSNCVQSLVDLDCGNFCGGCFLFSELFSFYIPQIRIWTLRLEFSFCPVSVSGGTCQSRTKSSGRGWQSLYSQTLLLLSGSRFPLLDYGVPSRRRHDDSSHEEGYSHRRRGTILCCPKCHGHTVHTQAQLHSQVSSSLSYFVSPVWEVLEQVHHLHYSSLITLLVGGNSLLKATTVDGRHRLCHINRMLFRMAGILNQITYCSTKTGTWNCLTSVCANPSTVPLCPLCTRMSQAQMRSLGSPWT